MKILIDIGHPAHVHYFKHFARIMQEKGHCIFFTTIEKEFEPYLLKSLGFDFKKLGDHKKSLVGKIIGLLQYNFRLFNYCLKVKPDIYLGAGSISASHVAYLLRKPFIQLEDTGNMEQIRLYLPFTKAVFTPESLIRQLGNKQIKYSGYQEICYLHPKYFKPSLEIYKILGLEIGTRFCLIRFVAWAASHDYGQTGLSNKDKIRIVNYLASKMKVFISSEKELPDELNRYRINIAFEQIHHVLAYSDLFVGEGATMASEAGILGTPSIYINTIMACNNEDQEKFGTVFNFRNGDGVIEKIDEILNIPDYKNTWKERSRKLLESKVDVTAMLVWFVENFPESMEIMKKDPDYQYNFK